MDMPTLNRVLLVDDDNDLGRIAYLALHKLGGLDVLLCTSGREAIEKAPGFAPDLFILDVMMPEMDGVETLTHLQADPRLSKVPTIFLTAKVQREEVERYFSCGAIGVISKPFDPLALAAKVRETWSRHFESTGH